MNTATALDLAIQAVCPIYGVSIGRRDDKSTWSIAFKESASEVQKRAAAEVLNAFDDVAGDDASGAPITTAQLKAAFTALGSVSTSQIDQAMAAAAVVKP